MTSAKEAPAAYDKYKRHACLGSCTSNVYLDESKEGGSQADWLGLNLIANVTLGVPRIRETVGNWQGLGNP